MAWVLGVLTEKGGASKSTLSQNAGAALEQRGYRVCIIDTDTQENSLSWYTERCGQAEAQGIDAPGPFVMSVTDARAIASTVKQFGNVYDVIIIDGTPGVVPITARSMEVCDAILIPVPPGFKDWQSTVNSVDLYKSLIERNGSMPPAAFLLTRMKPGQKISREFSNLVLPLGLPVLESKVHERTVFVEADFAWKAVTEFKPNSPAANEINAVIDELIANNFLPKLTRS